MAKTRRCKRGGNLRRITISFPSGKIVNLYVLHATSPLKPVESTHNVSVIAEESIVENNILVSTLLPICPVGTRFNCILNQETPYILVANDAQTEICLVFLSGATDKDTVNFVIRKIQNMELYDLEIYSIQGCKPEITYADRSYVVRYLRTLNLALNNVCNKNTGGTKSPTNTPRKSIKSSSSIVSKASASASTDCIQIELGQLHDLSISNMNTYSGLNTIIHAKNSLVLCLNVNNVCVSSIDMYFEPDSGEITINSYTAKRCQKKGFNLLLRGIIVHLARSIYGDRATLITSEAENPISAKVMMKYFGAKPVIDAEVSDADFSEELADDDEIELFEIVDGTHTYLTDETKQKAQAVIKDVLKKLRANNKPNKCVC